LKDAWERITGLTAEMVAAFVANNSLPIAERA
jgi:predicted transcriptional regulator